VYIHISSFKYPVIRYCHVSVGLQITGGASFVVGESAVLQCNTDLDATAVQWLYGGEVVVQSTAHYAELQFYPVNDSIHDRQYTCRVISPYGIQERNTTVTITGKI